MATTDRWSDERLEMFVGSLLRWGVVAAAALVALGGIVYLLRYGGVAPSVGTFHGEPEDLRRPAGIVRAALAGRGRGLIQLGLLVLIATPIARVAFSLFAFARQRDRLYVAITAVVLALLLVGLAGLAG
jgi:uncharacterized membrane protein